MRNSPPRPLPDESLPRGERASSEGGGANGEGGDPEGALPLPGSGEYGAPDVATANFAKTSHYSASKHKVKRGRSVFVPSHSSANQ